MKLSWNSLRISIAGARLSHLVQKDKIWDHGSMIEQVKNVFYAVEKAKNKKDAEAVKKYTTAKAYEQLAHLIGREKSKQPIVQKVVLSEVSIIQVSVKSDKNPDRFIALITGKTKLNESEDFRTAEENFGIKNFSAYWHFLRQGEWWLLDKMKPIH